MASALPAPGGRESFYRARRTSDGLEPAADREPASRRSLADTDVLIRRRAGAGAVAAGGFVETLDF